jgi:hypothetical protein
MPLIAKPATAPQPTPTPVPIVAAPVPLRLVYIDPDGQEWFLTDRSSGVVATACAGIAGPQPSLTAVNLPGGGGIAQFYRSTTRPIVVGLFVEASTQDDFLALMDRLARAFWNERRGEPAPGTLVVARPDGSSRQIPVICTDGADQSDDDRSKSGLTWSTFTLTFQALDPLWADAEATTTEFAVYSVTGVPPMPPVQLAPAGLLGQTSITNEGDADAYPVWTITGPGEPTITNTTTGRSFGLSVTLGSGETVTVDTRPTMQSAVDGDGDDRWGDLVKSSPRDLWPLVPGVNSLDLSMSGSGTGSKIALSYMRRWLRA